MTEATVFELTVSLPVVVSLLVVAWSELSAGPTRRHNVSARDARQPQELIALTREFDVANQVEMPKAA